MDELKLAAWRQRFNEEAKTIQTEFDAFFKDKPLDTYYQLNLDVSDELSLIIREDLPKEIRERLMQTLLATKPEDSI